MKRFPSRINTWLATCGLLTVSCAGAQIGPDVCALPEEVLEVHLAAALRGTAVVKVDGGRFWTEASVLRVGEEAYADAQVTCDGLNFVRLKPELKPVLDTASVSLRLQPVPHLLGWQRLQLHGEVKAQSNLQPLTLYSVDYALSGGVTLNASERNWQTASLKVNYRLDRLNASAGLTQSWQPIQGQRFIPEVRVRYRLGDNWSVQAQYNTPTHSLFGLKLLSGMSADGSRTYLRYLPKFGTVLELPATLKLRVDGQVMAQGSAGPGDVFWQNIPLRHSRGLITLEITDETGSRIIQQPYQFPANLLPPGGNEWHVAAGEVEGNHFAGVAGSLGLTSQLTVQGQATWQPAQAAAEVWGVLAPAGQDLRFGVSAQQEGSQWMGTGHLRFQGRRNTYTMGLQADVPFAAPTKPTLSASLSRASQQYNWNLQASYDLQHQTWQAQAAAGMTVNRALDLNAQASVRPGGWNAGVQLRYQPDAHWKVQAGSTYSPQAGQFSGAQLHYQISPAQQVQVQTDFRHASAQYQYTDQLYGLLSASSPGQAAGALRGSVIWTGGGVTFSPDQASGISLLVKTGQSMMAVYANGLYQGKTDQQGDLLLTTEPQENLRLSVRVNSLPIEVMVKEEQLDVPLPSEGSFLLDWRDNFSRMRWVQLHWPDGHVAADANVNLGRDSYPTDGEGYALVPASFSGQTVTLTSLDGKTTCQATLSTAEKVTCTASP